MTERERLYDRIECMLFVAGDPVPVTEIARVLELPEKEARALLTKLPEEYPLPPPSIEITGLTLEKLAKAFQKVLARAEAAERSESMAQREIRRDSFTVAGCMVRIARRLKGGSCRFSEFFAEDYSREEVITMFLAILEMARLSRLHVEQGGAYDEIYLSA